MIQIKHKNQGEGKILFFFAWKSWSGVPSPSQSPAMDIYCYCNASLFVQPMALGLCNPARKVLCHPGGTRLDGLDWIHEQLHISLEKGDPKVLRLVAVCINREPQVEWIQPCNNTNIECGRQKLCIEDDQKDWDDTIWQKWAVTYLSGDGRVLADL